MPSKDRWYIEISREELERLDKTLPDIAFWARSKPAVIPQKETAQSIWDENDEGHRRGIERLWVPTPEEEEHLQIAEGAPKGDASWPEGAAGRLYCVARGKYDAIACCEPGSLDGLVTAKGDLQALSIGSSSYGNFWIEISSATHIIRYELGSDAHWHKSRLNVGQSYGDLVVERIYDDELDALASHLAGLTFQR